MSGTATINAPLAPPAGVINVPGSGPHARCAPASLRFTAALPQITIDASQLGPSRGFDKLSTIYIDNNPNTTTVMVTFPDTGVTYECPGGAGVYVLAITGQLRVQFTNIVATPTIVNVALLNFNAGPTGVQPITGTVTAVIGPITVTNPGPAIGALSDESLGIIAATPTMVLPFNPTRKYMHFQFPAGILGVGSSDGWYSFTNAAVSPGAVGCFYAGAGQDVWSESFSPTNALYVYLMNNGEMPVNTG